MKILFTASQRGKKFYEKQYEMLFNDINKLGHNVLSDDILNTTNKNFYDELNKGGRNANVDLYKRKLKQIQDADICIYECSTHSLSIGFVVEKTLSLNKPAIVLYYQDNLPYFLSGVDDEKLIVKSYNDNNHLDIIRSALTEAAEVKDKRFNFFISPKLLTYLEETSKALGVTKSTFIRNLILNHKKKGN